MLRYVSHLQPCRQKPDQHGKMLQTPMMGYSAWLKHWCTILQYSHHVTKKNVETYCKPKYPDVENVVEYSTSSWFTTKFQVHVMCDRDSLRLTRKSFCRMVFGYSSRREKWLGAIHGSAILRNHDFLKWFSDNSMVTLHCFGIPWGKTMTIHYPCSVWIPSGKLTLLWKITIFNG